MSDLGDLLVGISVLLGAASSAFVLVWNTVRSGRKPEKVARSAADESAVALLEAIADGDLTSEELEQVRESLRKQQGGGSP